MPFEFPRKAILPENVYLPDKVLEGIEKDDPALIHGKNQPCMYKNFKTGLPLERTEEQIEKHWEYNKMMGRR